MKQIAIGVCSTLLLFQGAFSSPRDGKPSLVAVLSAERSSPTETSGVYHLALPRQELRIARNVINSELNNLRKTLNELPPGTPGRPAYWSPDLPRTFSTTDPVQFFTFDQLATIYVNKCIIDEYLLPKSIKKIRQNSSLSF